MPVKDIASDIALAVVMPETSIISSLPETGLSVDTADFGEGVAFFLNVALWTFGSFLLTLEESDNNNDWTDVPVEKYIGACLESAATIAGANQGKVGCFATKRYLRPKVTGIDDGDGIEATVIVTAVKAGEYLPTSVPLGN